MSLPEKGSLSFVVHYSREELRQMREAREHICLGISESQVTAYMQLEETQVGTEVTTISESSINDKSSFHSQLTARRLSALEYLIRKPAVFHHPMPKHRLMHKGTSCSCRKGKSTWTDATYPMTCILSSYPGDPWTRWPFLGRNMQSK